MLYLSVCCDNHHSLSLRFPVVVVVVVVVVWVIWDIMAVVTKSIMTLHSITGMRLIINDDDDDDDGTNDDVCLMLNHK